MTRDVDHSSELLIPRINSGSPVKEILDDLLLVLFHGVVQASLEVYLVDFFEQLLLMAPMLAEHVYYAGHMTNLAHVKEISDVSES